jgi:uncharacterized protein (DUF1800 family)
MDLNVEQKIHLHKRAEFFCHFNEISKNNNASITVDKIFKKQNIKTLCVDLPEWDEIEIKSNFKKNRQQQKKYFKEKVEELSNLWLMRMQETDKGLVEKMTLFWHGHFACRTITNPYHTIELNNILRENSLGNFKDMLIEVSQSAAMGNYLHLKQNKKQSPNEDFARELCELFTLGRDIDYTEFDITEIARAFSGWSTDNNGNHFISEKHHDNSEKEIFGKKGNFSGEDVIEMILKNKNTAKFIVTKIYSFFVQESINPNEIELCTNIFYDANYNIETLMKYIFKSDWFYKTQGKLIKSPIELIVGLGKIFDLSFDNKKSMKGLQYYLGHVLFNPPNVAGWPGGRQWIDASRLALRLRLGSLILNKGYIMDELNEELDAMFTKSQNKQVLKFYEDVNWDDFWKKNKNISMFDLLISNDNKSLQSENSNNNITNIIHLISTPDFQLT